MRALAVARKKAARSSPKNYEYVQVRMSTDFREWLGRLAERDRAGLSDVIDWALEHYAKATGFEPPPKR